MSMKMASAPPEGLALVRARAANRLGQLREHKPIELGGLEAKSLTVGENPTPVYSISVDAIRSSKPLGDAAVLRGWRYHFLREDEVVGVAETRISPGGVKDAGVHSGDAERAFGRLLAKASSMELGEEVEPRVVTLPSVFQFSALWLHGETRDYFLPVQAGAAGAEEDRIYEWEEVLARLRERLKELEQKAPGMEGTIEGTTVTA